MQALRRRPACAGAVFSHIERYPEPEGCKELFCAQSPSSAKVCQKKIRYRRRAEDDLLCRPDRPGRAHVPVRAVQYSLRFDVSRPAQGRLPVRLEIQLRLFELLDPVQPGCHRRSNPGGVAKAWRCGGFPAAEQHKRRFHQAGHRDSGRPHPGPERPVVPERQAGAPGRAADAQRPFRSDRAAAASRCAGQGR